ncbi:MAG: hypothetical protein ABI999_05160 [Acidobacteriota bacterium]
MRRINIIILCLTATISTFGQVKTLTKEQYDTVVTTSRDQVDKLLRRVVSETTKYKGGVIETTETLTKESLPSGDNRWSLITKKEGVTLNKLQLVYLGKYEYRKEGESDWKKRCVKDCSSSESEGSYGILGSAELPKVQEFLVSDSTAAGQSATVYVSYRVYQIGSILNFFESKIWIGSNGLILKEESIDSDVFPTNRKSFETISYAYNPKDVALIEAPIK